MGWWLPWQPRAGLEKATLNLCRRMLPRVPGGSRQRWCLPCGSAAGVVDTALGPREWVMPRRCWLGEAQGLVQDICFHLRSPPLQEGTGGHSSLQGYPKPALMSPFQPCLPKAHGSAIMQILFFAVCGSVCPVPQLGMFCFSRRCPPGGRWLRCVPLISLSGAGEPGLVHTWVAQGVCGALKGRLRWLLEPGRAPVLGCKGGGPGPGHWLAWTRGPPAGAWGAGGGSTCPGGHWLGLCTQQAGTLSC